ncbi:MAG TPA: acVLRF1 family peptidyl-tRNA hydrolase [Nocardioidaceae bacterium]|nr:acVLRF1 family peptidyl-tRNA hydrolase [Nocardioidaceae bacterium]
MSAARTVLVPAERVVRWFDNFGTRHGAPSLAVHGGRLVATAPDGAVAEAAVPFSREYDGPPDAASFRDAARRPVRWGVLLVRKGGFAVAAGTDARPLVSKVGRRHVQGRTKAGGQSQQRFARRRDNQARQAYEAAADHAHRVLVTEFGRVEALVCGGDRSAVDAVLSDPRLAALAAVRVEPWLPVADPRRAVLDQAVADARSTVVTVTEPGPGAPRTAHVPAG